MKKFLFIFGFIFLSGCQSEQASVPGYVEGEYILVSPTTSSVLETLSVKRGQKVQSGDMLFSLDLTDITAQKYSAEAEVLRAEAELADLLKGERPEELEILMKQQEQAKTTLQNTVQEYERLLPLSKAGAVSISKRDDAKTALDNAQSKSDEIAAQIKVANLGARIDKINAAKATVEMAKQAVVQTDKRIKEAAPHAPEAGVVEDTFFLPGEYVSSGQPVVKFLPNENIKVRFFVSQEKLPEITLGQAISISCSGCTETYRANISYIAQESEYTPPVIFSVESRDKLVFMIEATPTAYHSQLRPGLPIDVELK